MSSTSRKNEMEKAKNEIEFPFHLVADLTMSFVDIPGKHEVLAALPDEFKSHHNKWCKLANQIFFKGLSGDVQHLIVNPKVYNQQLRYVRCWLGSWDVKHEEKEAVVGWLLSIVFKDIPEK